LEDRKIKIVRKLSCTQSQMTKKTSAFSDEYIQLWLKDLDDSLRMLEKIISCEAYPVVAFWLHLTVEKSLKAAIVVLKKAAPPKVHNLVELHSKIADEVELTEEQIRFLRQLSLAVRETRYFDATLELPSVIYTKAVVDEFMTKALPIIKVIKARIEEERT
jgi:HEPN domain-containing protein